ncbi:O-antigen/teichoic acid export membrane protein [Lewinella aquimaris]|uniref:O-antigen/teichoic acid export membrane protein n=1 Tax=Neolewinella aquimaris TaxID=1835722 RepID=A0A840E5T8_9BACT|nr:lipopolysaccharide biosynthesis protein [Neolewinella aquimaris]MBB4079323.1 O-antigen/teichoic acid export membrane protein [Neolewinella aquimaris]
MSLKKLSGETLVYGLSSILGRLLNFALVTPFVTRVMSDGEFGEVGNLMFWTALLIALLVFRMDTAVFRFASRGEYDPRDVFRRAQWLVVILTFAVIGPLLAFSDPIAELLEAPRAATYVQLVLVTIAFDALSAVPLARLRLQQRAWFFVAANLGNVVINILLIYFLLYYLPTYLPEYFEPSFRVGYYLVSIAVAAGLRYLVLLADGLRQPRPRSRTDAVHGGRSEVQAPSLRRLLRYSLPLTVVSVAGIANTLVGPSILIDHNAAWAGYFKAALSMAVFLNLFITAYQYAAEPFFFRQSGADLATADRGIYADAMRAYGLVGTLASAGIILGLPWLQYFIGPDVRPGLVVLPILLAANFLFGIYSNLSIAYKLTDQTFLGGVIAAVGSIFAVGGPLLFTGRYGIYAPAVGMLACFLVMCVLVYFVSRRYFPVNYPFGRILIYVVLAVGVCLLGNFSAALPWRVFLLLVLIAALFLVERKWLRRTFMGGAAGAV